MFSQKLASKHITSLKKIESGVFFANIPLILNEKRTLDACYLQVLSLLQENKIEHRLPNELNWNFSSNNPESFVYLNHYILELRQGNEYEISGEILQHEPYHIPDYVIANFLSIQFLSVVQEGFRFIFAFFDGDLQAQKLSYDHAYYLLEVPEKYKKTFENRIHGN